MSVESKFAIMSRLATQIFQEGYAGRVNELYRSAVELHEKLRAVQGLQKSILGEASSAEQRRQQRDEQLGAMAVMPVIYKELPIVLKDLRIVQLEFEAAVQKAYSKQAYNKKGGSTTPLEEDALWTRVLPEEIADCLSNIVADCPASILARFQDLLDKEKQSAPETLKQLLKSSQRGTLLTSTQGSLLGDSKRCTEKLRASLTQSTGTSEVQKNTKPAK